jgi:hypothetical protein
MGHDSYGPVAGADDLPTRLYLDSAVAMDGADELPTPTVALVLDPAGDRAANASVWCINPYMKGSRSRQVSRVRALE